MDTANAARDDLTLNAVRRRSQSYLGYFLWVAVVLLFLWACNEAASLVEHWVRFLDGARHSIGMARPSTGPDYWIIGGVSLLILAGISVLAGLYIGYRAAWRRRLRTIWIDIPAKPAYLRIPPLRARATDADLRERSDYLHALASLPEWQGLTIDHNGTARESYEHAAAVLLREIETDIAKRAITAGLVVGLNRNALLDGLTIVASALELQLHVLTRLGKRPSPRAWIELLKRAGASVFLNTYVSREDALYLNLAIRKAALGLEMASDSMQELANHMADIDWDDVLGSMSVPGFSWVTSAVSMGMTVGSFGLHQIGAFVENTSNDLLQGVLAGGILYFHGMALAADCLALDGQHRRSPEMTRSVGQAMTIACNPAGRLLRAQVQSFREFLRARRRRAFGIAKNAATDRLGKLRDISAAKLENLKDSTGLSRKARSRPSARSAREEPE